MLQDGEKFSFSFLATHVEDCCAYWDWWWENQSNFSQLSRPEIIADEDPILENTVDKMWVDTISHASFFDKFLATALKHEFLPSGHECARSAFGDRLIDHLATRAMECDDPHIIFAGGGYGAGKTTILGSNRACPFLNLPSRSQIGVDVFKRFLPEYEILSRLGDGRASSTVQLEARSLSEKLFEYVTTRQHSFIWDSSLSNLAESKQKIQVARAKGYKLHLVAAASPIQAAIARAMARARQIRRFANPAHLANSHRNFASAFEEYFDLFDTVQLFWNSWTPGSPDEQPRLIAEKDTGKNLLVVYGEEEFSEFSLLRKKL